MKSLLIKTSSKNYPVHIGNDIFKSLPDFVNNLSLSKRVFIVIDKKVEHIYGKLIRKVVDDFAVKKYILSLTSSENIKSFNSSNQIYNILFEKEFGRDTLLIAIGGGTIGDLAGFVASTYMRGISLTHIPTTLLSAVDSSVGGKTAVNFKDAKNLIGSFYQPDLVLIDTKFLKSLPNSELISGFGEVIKYSYLTDKKFYSTLHAKSNLLLKRDSLFLNKIIYESIKIKSAIVSKDEKEDSGLRKILNFGHTFAHAYESNSSYKLSHGNAVIAGIVSALVLSYEKKLIDVKEFDHMLELPLKFRQVIKLKKFNPENIFDLMVHDKKNQAGKNKFVLLRNFGEILVDVSVDKRSILKSLKRTEQIWFKRATAGL